MPTTSEDVLTRKQAAELLGLTKGGMRALEKSGLLQSIPRREANGRIVSTYATDKVMRLVKDGPTAKAMTVTRMEVCEIFGLTKSGVCSMERRGVITAQNGVFDKAAIDKVVAERQALEPGEGWLTHNQAAELFGLSPKKLRNKVRDAGLTTMANASRRIYYNRDELEAYAEKAAYKPEPPPAVEPELLEMTALILHLMEPIINKLDAIEERVDMLVKELTS